MGEDFKFYRHPDDENSQWGGFQLLGPSQCRKFTRKNNNSNSCVCFLKHLCVNRWYSHPYHFFYRNVKLWSAPTRSYNSKCGLWNENAMSCVACGMHMCSDTDVLQVPRSNRGLLPPSPWKRTLPIQQTLLRVCHPSWHKLAGLIKVNITSALSQELRRIWELLLRRHQLVSRQCIPLVLLTLPLLLYQRKTFLSLQTGIPTPLKTRPSSRETKLDKTLD